MMIAMQPDAFKRYIRGWYKKHGRHTLPWRKTRDPYKIAVSEVMLQQTQVSRVLQKYKEFLKQFPTVTALAEANLSEVITAWSGLGYNRRAKFLHLLARTVLARREFPDTINELKKLPGIGPYTASAIAAFAYNIPSVLIETNIRTVYIHHFFPKKKNVSDADIIPWIKKTLDMKNPREWYWALMDYGSHLKAQGIKTHRASKHYTKQPTFTGSKRQVRGEVIKMLTIRPQHIKAIYEAIARPKSDIDEVLKDLLAEGLIQKRLTKYCL